MEQIYKLLPAQMFTSPRLTFVTHTLIKMFSFIINLPEQSFGKRDARSLPLTLRRHNTKATEPCYRNRVVNLIVNVGSADTYSSPPCVMWRTAQPLPPQQPTVTEWMPVSWLFKCEQLFHTKHNYGHYICCVAWCCLHWITQTRGEKQYSGSSVLITRGGLIYMW